MNRSPRVLGNRLTPEQKARRLTLLREMWTHGEPRAQIAVRLGVAEQTVSWLAHKAGLPPRQRRAAR